MTRLLRLSVVCTTFALGCGNQGSPAPRNVNDLLKDPARALKTKNAQTQAAADHQGSHASLDTNEPVPGVNPSLVPPGITRMTAALSAQPSGPIFRASITPGEFVDAPYRFPRSIAQDTQISLATDTSTASTSGAKTSAAVATYLYNPTSLRGPLAFAALQKCESQKEKDAILDACAPLDFDAIYDKCVLDSDAATHATCTAGTDIDEQVQRLCALDSTGGSAAKCGEAVRQLVTAACISAEKKRAIVACADARNQGKKAAPAAEDKCLLSKFTVYNRKVLACQWRELASQAAPQVQISAAASMFPFGYFNDPAGKNSGIAQPFAGVSAQLLVAFRPHEQFQFSVWGTYQFMRSSSAPGVRLDDYWGAAAQVAWMFYTFIDTSHLDFDSKSDAVTNYVKTGYVPGLILGVSGQFVHCVEANATCAQSLPTQWSVTPFFDTKIIPALQFRVAVQINQGPLVDTSALGVSPFVSVASSF